MEKKKKFFLQCSLCNYKINDFSEWFSNRQRCPECGSNQAHIHYTKDVTNLKSLLLNSGNKLSGLWRYFDFLPLNNKKNIISCGEGDVQIVRWDFIEKLAKSKYNINCTVYAHRYDNSFATGTFKDLAGSVVSSVLKENNIQSYVVATTGNIGVAYTRYLTDAGITLYVFIPRASPIAHEAEISCFGQKVFRVDGDYSRTKELALEFSQKHDITLAAGNFDPLRIEAKKTMVYEWLRMLPEFPTVYIQGLSGGTGPLAIAKGCKEIENLNLFKKLPRFIMIQTDKCSPMADAWKKAKKDGFPKDWEKFYPIYNNPETTIPTLATGYPKTYPVLSPLIRQSEGEILSFAEKYAIDVARYVAYNSAVRIGPAAAIAVGGFLKALKNKYIKNDDIVMLNIGDGIRRDPDFMKQLIYTTTHVKNLDECSLFDRKSLEPQITEFIETI